MNIVLIGYRGSGKTTVGKLLAEEEDAGYIDTDELIVHMAGRSIAEIFAAEGEAGFRTREAAALKLAMAKPNRVISVGGGAIESKDNRNRMRGYGTVVWLEAPPEVLWERIQADPASAGQRPNLTSGGLEEVREVLARRAPLYAEAAHIVVRAGGRTPRQVMSDIQEWLAAQG